MIYILSLNPSIDYHMDIDDLQLGETNHSNNELMQIGGKGINVASVLNSLGTQSTLIGFIGGDTGNFISRELNKLPFIKNKMIKTHNPTRINIKLKGNVETEINGKGKSVEKEDIQKLELLINDIKQDDTVIITGRIAEGMPVDWYIQLAKMTYVKKANLIIDLATKDLIKMCQYEPLLVKPNISELERIFNVSIKSKKDAITYAKKLIEKGAINCIVSMGSKGSILINKDKIYTANIPKGTLVNSVGAGDSMVAGFCDAYLRNKNLKQAYKQAVACGSATAYTQHLASKDSIEKLIKEIEIGEYYET